MIYIPTTFGRGLLQSSRHQWRIVDCVELDGWEDLRKHPLATDWLKGSGTNVRSDFRFITHRHKKYVMGLITKNRLSQSFGMFWFDYNCYVIARSRHTNSESVSWRVTQIPDCGGCTEIGLLTAPPIYPWVDQLASQLAHYSIQLD